MRRDVRDSTGPCTCRSQQSVRAEAGYMYVQAGLDEQARGAWRTVVMQGTRACRWKRRVEEAQAGGWVSFPSPCRHLCLNGYPLMPCGRSGRTVQWMRREEDTVRRSRTASGQHPTAYSVELARGAPSLPCVLQGWVAPAERRDGLECGGRRPKALVGSTALGSDAVETWTSVCQRSGWVDATMACSRGRTRNMGPG